jgi:D-glycero-alpha-D-manno-heptose-7-phosphate kinase
MEIRSRAPLRLGLAGGGTDVSPYSDLHGGSVLNATINLYAYAILKPLEQKIIRIFFADQNLTFEASLEAPLPLQKDFEIPCAIFNYIQKNYPGRIQTGFELTTFSDVPAGSGLGSSSTFAVSILAAFADWLHLPLGEYDLARLAYLIERKDCGFLGGKQDQYAATFGGFNFIEFGADERVLVNPLRVKNSVIKELELQMILYYTGQSRSSAQIIKQQIDNTVNQKSTAIEAMHGLKRDSVLMKEHLLRGDIQSFGQVLGDSWKKKKEMAAQISNSEIDQLYDLVLTAGVYAGKVSGAGGGGFMVFMCSPEKKPQVKQLLESRNGKVYNFHFVSEGVESWRV